MISVPFFNLTLFHFIFFTNPYKVHFITFSRHWDLNLDIILPHIPFSSLRFYSIFASLSYYHYSKSHIFFFRFISSTSNFSLFYYILSDISVSLSLIFSLFGLSIATCLFSSSNQIIASISVMFKSVSFPTTVPDEGLRQKLRILAYPISFHIMDLDY